MLHTQLLQQRGQALLDHRLGQGFTVFAVLQLQHGADIFLHREFSEDRGLLRQIRHAKPRAPVDRHVAHRAAINEDVARVAAHQANDHVERRGFAGAVGAEQAHDFALAHIERDILDHLAPTVGLGQVPHLEQA